MNLRMVGLILTLLLVTAGPAAAGGKTAGDATVQNCASGCVTGQPIRGHPWTDDMTIVALQRLHR